MLLKNRSMLGFFSRIEIGGCMKIIKIITVFIVSIFIFATTIFAGEIPVVTGKVDITVGAKEVFDKPFGVENIKSLPNIKKVLIIGGNTEEGVNSFVNEFTKKVVESKKFDVVGTATIMSVFGDVCIPINCPAKYVKHEYKQQHYDPQTGSRYETTEYKLILTNFDHLPINLSTVKLSMIREKTGADAIVAVWFPYQTYSAETSLFSSKEKLQSKVYQHKCIIVASMYDIKDGSEIWYGFNEAYMKQGREAAKYLDICCCNLPFPNLFINNVLFTGWKRVDYGIKGKRSYSRFYIPFVKTPEELINGWVKYGSKKFSQEFLLLK